MMLSAKRYVFVVIFIIFLCGVWGVFSGGLTGNSIANSTPSSSINVQLLWQQNVLNCQAPFKADNGNKAWYLDQFQFYISDIKYGSEKAGWQKVNLTQTAFQAHETVLLGTNCRAAEQLSNMMKSSNWAIDIEQDNQILNDGTYIRFTLGVPFQVNHLNPLSQKSPLNLPSMFWVWQTGHKFMRLELATSDDQWLFHLGSTGCKSASVMRAPEQACRYPNTFHFELPLDKNQDDQPEFSVDLAELLNNVELTSASSCQSEQDKLSCQQLFDNLSPIKKSKNTSVESRVFKAVNIKRESAGSNVE
ncbi:MbnP family copper-binding protein [Cognaticolwellia beringensis]|nr:MbnP family copper-binding protein [Cognaticolwellia beringensis]